MASLVTSSLATRGRSDGITVSSAQFGDFTAPVEADTTLREPAGLVFVTVTAVRVTGDLQHATIFYTVYGDDQDLVGTGHALESAKGILRSEVGRNITARLTPTLTFVADEIPADAARLESLLRTAREKDAQVAEQAQGAQYAAGEDAYRTSDADDEAPESRSRD